MVEQHIQEKLDHYRLLIEALSPGGVFARSARESGITEELVEQGRDIERRLIPLAEERGRRHEAVLEAKANLTAAHREAAKLFSKQRRKAVLRLRKRVIQTALGLRRKRPTGRAALRVYMRSFYTNGLQVPEARAGLASIRITSDDLIAAIERLDAIDELVRAEERARAAKAQAVKAMRSPLSAMSRWHSALRWKAYDAPDLDLRRALGLYVPSSALLGSEDGE